MNRNELAVGQIITVGTEVEFWQSGPVEALDWRTDRWAPFQIKEIVELGPDYVTMEVECKDGIYSGTIELDLDYDDIELAK